VADKNTYLIAHLQIDMVIVHRRHFVCNAINVVKTNLIPVVPRLLLFEHHPKTIGDRISNRFAIFAANIIVAGNVDHLWKKLPGLQTDFRILYNRSNRCFPVSFGGEQVVESPKIPIELLGGGHTPFVHQIAQKQHHIGLGVDEGLPIGLRQMPVRVDDRDWVEETLVKGFANDLRVGNQKDFDTIF
jgi:hypothetical protein